MIRRHGLLMFCCLCSFLAYLDRGLFGVLLMPIKNEFQLSDVAAGGLAGFVFAISYALLGVPLGSLVDRARSRRLVLGVCVAVWSGMTVLCGMATSATFLIVAQLGVGAAEAGMPSSVMSMLSDRYPHHQLARAIGCFQIFVVLGTAMAFPLAGHIATVHGWRSVFVYIGIAGLLIAPLFIFALPEPARTKKHDAGSKSFEEVIPLKKAISTLIRSTHIMLLFSACAFGGMLASMVTWLAAFYQRSYGGTLATAGQSIGSILIIVGPIAILFGGWLADRLGTSGVKRIMNLLAAILVAQMVFGALMFSSSTPMATKGFAIFWLATVFSWSAPGYALSQRLVHPRMRGTSMAVLGLFTNLAGYGLGPVVVGAISTALGPRYGAESLRWALFSASIGLGFMAALLLYMSGRAMPESDAQTHDGFVGGVPGAAK